MSEDTDIDKVIKNGDDFEKSIKEFTDYLLIDKEALDDECMYHTVRFDLISAAHTRAQDVLDQAKFSAETAYAELDIQIRREYEARGEKITEAKISNFILTSPIYKQLCEAMLDLKQMERRLNGLKEAFIQRSQRIDNLCRLYSAGYFEREQVKKGGEKAFETSFMDKIKTKDCTNSKNNVTEVLKNLKNKQNEQQK